MICRVTRLRGLLLVLSVAGAGLACVDRLPAQDLRILTAQPAAKLSAADLWRDFQADAAGARARYFGQALDISDAPTVIETDLSKSPHAFFAQPASADSSGADARGVRAFLLDERAAEVIKEAKPGQRLTLRCFCEGMDDKKDVVLKSCVKP